MRKRKLGAFQKSWVRMGRRLRSDRPHFEPVLEGIKEVVDPIMAKDPSLKGVLVFGTVPDILHKDVDVLIMVDERAHRGEVCWRQAQEIL